MAYFLLVTIGYLLVLGMMGGALVFFLLSSLDTKDSTTIDPLKIGIDEMNSPNSSETGSA